MENDAAEGVAPAPLAIESLDDYVRRFGLPHADADNEAGGDRFERLEASERVRAEEAHFHQVIEKHQKPAADEGNGARMEESSEGAVISVLLADNSSHTTPVSPLVAFCDTVKRMVSTRKRFGVAETACANNEMKVSEEKAEEDGEKSLMVLSLVEFDATAALQFIGVLTSLQLPSRKRRLDDAGDATNKHIKDLIDEGKIAEENIVECIRVAHYLQCVVILEALTSILEVSIDSHNCMSICSLADALNLTSLFEASVNYVIERLDAFQGNVLTDTTEGGGVAKRASSTVSSSEEGGEGQEEVWASLPHELRSRVLTMRNVMRSSVVGRGSKVSGIFFSSGQEFLAIFRESIRDQKERLADARERSEQVIRDRMEEWSARCQRRGRWFDASPEAKRSFVYASDVTYGLRKIDKQANRLATLESFYEEQKVIFKGSGFGSEIRL